jgi:hypothetical protein
MKKPISTQLFMAQTIQQQAAAKQAETEATH